MMEGVSSYVPQTQRSRPLADGQNGHSNRLCAATSRSQHLCTVPPQQQSFTRPLSWWIGVGLLGGSIGLAYALAAPWWVFAGIIVGAFGYFCATSQFNNWKPTDIHNNYQQSSYYGYGR